MAKIRIKQKDFYEAFFTLQRAIDKNFKSKRLILYKDFTEGVLYLIKRQGDKGVELLTSLLSTIKDFKDSGKKIMAPTILTLSFNSYIYRAYGHLFNGAYKEGHEDLTAAKLFDNLDKASEYNEIIAEGVMSTLYTFEYPKAHELFEKAKEKFPENKDPYLLQSLNIVMKWYKENSCHWIDDSERRNMLLMAKKLVDEAIDSKCKLDSVIFYYRGLLNYYLHCFYEALLDFEMAIDKDDEPGAWLYLARGRSFACLSMLNEAIKDFSIAINLDEKWIDAYLCRGKWSYLVGNNTQAFMDFQKIIVLDPKNPKAHVYAGNLLMTTGAYGDATKAYINADVVANTAEAAFHRGRCYAALTNLDEAISELKKVIELKPNEKLVFPDLDCLEILNNLAVTSGETNENSKRNSENGNSEVNSENEDFNKTQILSDGNTEGNKKQKEIILDIKMDKDILDLSIKAMDKLINYFNPSNSTFDQYDNPIYQFK